MEILKTDVRTIMLERYSIEREASGEPLTVRAELQISTPDMDPQAVRIRVRYQYGDIPSANEREFGRRLLQLLRNRLGES
jgi:hypothetical protein